MSGEKKLARPVLSGWFDLPLCRTGAGCCPAECDHTVNIPDSISAFLVLTGH